jgi:hypothetical protein
VSDRSSEPIELEAASAAQNHGILARAAALGVSTQAVIPGFYAWAITVAPFAWARGASGLAKLFACLGLGTLIGALFEGRALRWRRSRSSPESEQHEQRPLKASVYPTVLFWGLTVTSGIVWVLAPASAGAARLDALRGVLGMVGWALFAFASAGPTLRALGPEEAAKVTRTALRPRPELSRTDTAYVALGIAATCAMQLVGWNAPTAERALLVRLVTILGGIVILGAFTNLAVARQAVVPSRARLRRAAPWILMLVLCGVAGVVVGMAR